jgi:hypothetical protein
MTDPGPIEFHGILQQSDASGAACWVDFPYDLKATYGKGNLVPIRALFDHRVEYRGSLAKMGGDCAMLLVRKDVLAEIGKQKGETVAVRVELDAAPRSVTLPGDAIRAIEENESASAIWNGLSYSRQREYQLWIDGAKRPETRQRRVEKMVELLAQGKPLK